MFVIQILKDNNGGGDEYKCQEELTHRINISRSTSSV